LVERLRILLDATSRSNGPVAVIERARKVEHVADQCFADFEPYRRVVLPGLHCMIAAREYDFRSKTSYAPAAATGVDFRERRKHEFEQGDGDTGDAGAGRGSSDGCKRLRAGGKGAGEGLRSTRAGDL
jgi:hypothetical protein